MTTTGVTLTFSSISVTIGAFMFWVLLIITYIDKKRNGQKENKYFKYLLVLDMILIITRVSSITLKSYEESYGLLINILAKVYSCSITYITITFTFLLIDYLGKELNISSKTLKKFAFPIFSIPLIGILLLDAQIELLNGVYTFTGNYTYLSYAYIALLLIAIFYLSIKNRKNITFEKMLPIIFSALIYAGDMIFQWVFNLIFLDVSSIYVMITIILYLTYENQDNKLLNEYLESKKESEKVSVAKTEFLIDMSHQIRTPLSTILGLGEVLNNGESKTPEEIKSNIETIKESSNVLTYLVDNLLDVSKLENENIELNNQEYALNNLLYEIDSVIKPRITANKNIRIDLNHEIPSKYYGDNKMVFKVITYLLFNAFNNSQYGNISLWIDGKKEEKNFNFEIVITTTGVINTKENFDLTMEDYINNRKEIKSDLIIAKKIAQILGGKIELNIDEKQCTKYIFTVKQQIVDESIVGDVFGEETLRQRKNRSDYTGKKGLIIGNLNSNVRLFMSNLQAKNMEIKQVTSGKNVRDEIISNKYDLIFINYDLLDIELKNVVENLKSAGVVLPPIIVLAAYPSSVEKNINDGVSMYLKMPIENTQLYNSINEVLGGENK